MMNYFRDTSTSSDAVQIMPTDDLPPENVCTETAGEIPVESGRKCIRKPCNFFIKGEECPFGETCLFLHHETWKKIVSFASYGDTDDAGFLDDMMSHRRDSDAGSDAIHVLPTDEPPPENRYDAACATEDAYSHVYAVNPDDAKSPSKKTHEDVHSVEEVLRPTPNRQETAAETRTEFKIPTESERSYKESSTFLHDEASKNRASFGGYGAGDSGNVAQTRNPMSWKRKICYMWVASGGYCRFGVNCLFAHGSSELQSVSGGLIERESKMRKSATMEKKLIGQAETVTSLVPPGVPTQQTSSDLMQKPNRLNTEPKWGGPDKISWVYADWIDD